MAAVGGQNDTNLMSFAMLLAADLCCILYIATEYLTRKCFGSWKL